jgi:hypothetical protein
VLVPDRPAPMSTEACYWRHVTGRCRCQKSKYGLACVWFGGELLPQFESTRGGSVQFIVSIELAGLLGFCRQPLEPPHVDHAGPPHSPAAYADDRQLYRLQCAKAIQFPREDPLWSSDPPASIALLLCDCGRDYTPTTAFFRKGELVYHIMGRYMVKSSWSARLPPGGLI